MSSDSQFDTTPREMDGDSQTASEIPSAYPLADDTYDAADFSSEPREVGKHPMKVEPANLPQFVGLSPADSTTSHHLYSNASEDIEIIPIEVGEFMAGASSSPRNEATSFVKNENIDDDDIIHSIKKEGDSDDLIITKAWGRDEAIDVDAESVTCVKDYDLADQAHAELDHDPQFQELEQDDEIPRFIKEEIRDDLVIGNIWNISEAIDVDAEYITRPAEDSPTAQQTMKLEICNRFQETEEDRIDQNYQTERIARARERLRVRSLVNEASMHPQSEPEPRDTDEVAPVSVHDNSTRSDDPANTLGGDNDITWGQSIVFDEAELEGIGGPSAPDPQSDCERSDGLFCSDYDEETKASLKRNRGSVAVNGSTSTGSPHEEPVNAPPQTKRRRYARNMEVSARERRESMKVGMETALSKSQKAGVSKTKGVAGASKKTSRHKSGNSGVTKGKKKNVSKSDRSTGKGNRPVNLDLRNLLRSNVIGDAQANASQPAIPKSLLGDKRKVLNEMAQNSRSGDSRQVKADKALISKATKTFGKKLKADGKGGWKLKGMKTSLFHHQLIGLDFMRRRENSEVAPFGGFMCDEMGFGKTIQALANVVDGVAEPDDPVKTTLIVVPRHLVSLWASQIKIHCEEDALGTILRYHSGSRPETSNPTRDLGQYGIIITTYDEVRRSYPVFSPPNDLKGDTALQDWWADEYERKSGHLHSLRFRRIILDEAHMIKNFKSRTSVAVRALTATFRWAMSGTIVQNGVDEFFSFFSFLRIPEVDQAYSGFVKDCRKGEDGFFKHVSNLVSPMMIRRTHTEKLFGYPILKLPGIEERPITVKFNETERFIYRLLGKEFMDLINSFKDPLDVGIQCQCILTTYLRLRMFASHILVIQEQLKGLLTTEVMEVLRETVHSASPAPEPTDLKTVDILENLTNNFNTPSSTSSQVCPQDQPRQKRNAKLTDEFCCFLAPLKANNNVIELVRRCLCPVCNQPPVEAYITSCMHIYCAECLPSSEHENKIECMECEVEITKTEYCHSIETLGLDEHASSIFSGQGGPKESRSKKRKSKGSKKGGNGMNPEDEELVTPDWIPIAGHEMHGAKLAATRSCIKDWFSRSDDTKVLIFTQFLDMGRILGLMCDSENWGFVTINGKMPIAARDTVMEKFREDQETRILICSLRAGGTGLDLTAANKCILVDLWWNSAVEQQAFCRVFRIGQKKDVEIVKVVVEGSTDDWLTRLQERKATAIEEVMGPDALQKAKMVEAIAAPFGTVKQQEDGLFRIRPHEDGQNGSTPV